MKSGNLNFLEPSGPLQACNGTALPLPFTYDKVLFQQKKIKLWNERHFVENKTDRTAFVKYAVKFIVA